jgi:hypothetical protein
VPTPASTGRSVDLRARGDGRCAAITNRVE